MACSWSTERRDRGFALLIVLWAVVLLTVLVTGITASGRADVQLAANLRSAALAEAAADGAVFEGAFHLLDPAHPWQADGRPEVIEGRGARIVVRIEDEAGKVNPNTATPALLDALLRQVGADTQSASHVSDAIVDWRFPGAQPRPDGAKAPQYRAAGLDYGPPEAPFESLDELGAVLGMTPALLARLRPYVSVLTDTPPDPMVARPVVLRALQTATGADPARTGKPVSPRTVTVTASVITARGSRFIRQAAIRLGTTPREPLVRVLTWRSLPDDTPAR